MSTLSLILLSSLEKLRERWVFQSSAVSLETLMPTSFVNKNLCVRETKGHLTQWQKGGLWLEIKMGLHAVPATSYLCDVGHRIPCSSAAHSLYHPSVVSESWFHIHKIGVMLPYSYNYGEKYTYCENDPVIKKQRMTLISLPILLEMFMKFAIK